MRGIHSCSWILLKERKKTQETAIIRSRVLGMGMRQSTFQCKKIGSFFLGGGGGKGGRQFSE